MKTEIIVFLSPRSATGVTTISNYFLNKLADPNKKETALLIEFSKSTGKTIYMNGNTTEMNKCLSNIVVNTYLLKENLNVCRYNKNCFYLCQNLVSKITDLESYPIDCLATIIEEVRKTTPVNYIILDLPSDLLERARIYVLSKKFRFDIDHTFVVLDEDALTFNKLKDMSELSSLYDDPKRYSTYIVNKTTENYVDYIDRYSAVGFPSINLLKLPYIREMNDIINRGNIYGMGNDKDFKEFQKGIDMMVSIVKNKEAGYGLNFDKESVEDLISMKYNLVTIDSEPGKTEPRRIKTNTKDKKKSKVSKDKEAKNDSNPKDKKLSKQKAKEKPKAKDRIKSKHKPEPKEEISADEILEVNENLELEVGEDLEIEVDEDLEIEVKEEKKSKRKNIFSTKK